MKKALIVLLLLVFTGCSNQETSNDLADIVPLNPDKDKIAAKYEEPEEIDEEEELDESEGEENTAHSVSLTSPTPNAKLSSEPITFTGVLSEGAVRVTATASFKDEQGEAQEDVYQLQNFEEGDVSFEYRASPDWGNLGEGENVFSFLVEFDDGKKLTEEITITFTP